MTEAFLLEEGAAWSPPDVFAPLPASAGERLHLAAMRMAGRLADLVGALEPTSEATHFLRRLAASAGPGGTDGSVLDLPALEPHPLDRAAARLGLDVLDLDLLVLAALPGEREELAAIVRDLHPERRPVVSGGLAAAMAEAALLGGTAMPGGAVRRREAVRDRLTIGLLRRSGLVQLDASAPFAEAAVVTGDAIWAALRGEDRWPASCEPLETPGGGEGLRRFSATSGPRAATEAFRRLEPVVAFTACDRPEAAAARLAGLVNLAGRSARILRLVPANRTSLRLAVLHAMVRDVVPIVVVDEPVRLELGAAAVAWPVAICGPSGISVRAFPRPLVEVPFGPLGREDRMSALAAALPGLEALGRPVGPATVDPADLTEAAVNLHAVGRLTGSSPGLREAGRALERIDGCSAPTGTVVVHPAATFDDLVVDDDVMAQLREASDRLEHREVVLERWGFLAGRPGREGLRLLFHGPPGTGKTLAAEVLAGALGRDLLVVDLSRMVSKWVGETEKHLAATFEAAERTGSALLFDEADALFGRRTEVSDARDRYANLETAYLLSRIERFDGLVVLATNLRQNLDGAFARRIDYVVGFDPPDAGQRARLWRRLVPPDAPLDPAVNLDQIAALYAIPGGLIRNAAVAAGYLAASDGSSITTAHLVHAIGREYAKAGQHFPGEPGPRPADRGPAGPLSVEGHR